MVQHINFSPYFARTSENVGPINKPPCCIFFFVFASAATASAAATFIPCGCLIYVTIGSSRQLRDVVYGRPYTILKSTVFWSVSGLFKQADALFCRRQTPKKTTALTRDAVGGDLYPHVKSRPGWRRRAGLRDQSQNANLRQSSSPSAMCL